MTLEQAIKVVERATPIGDGNPHPEPDLTRMIEGITPYYIGQDKEWGYFCDGQNVFVSVGQEDVASSLVYKIECMENLLFMIGRE